MIELSALFPNSTAITPAASEEERAEFAAIPGKAAVYLLTGVVEGEERPVLLATVGDLRAALRRRLGDAPAEVKTKRVAYGQICTRVHWREVHSAFGANFYYAAAARALFPQTATALIPWRAAWWVAVERGGPGATPFPRFRKTNNLADASLAYAGPMYDKHAAQRLVESLEDLFDLCRYHNILVQAPHGKACAYKEMGKCPAPCDGSVSLESYRGQIDAALAFVTDAPGAPGAGGSSRAAWREKIAQQMKVAAAQLQFETAAKIKQRLARAGLLNAEPYAATARLKDFAFLALQPGKGKPWIEPWIIHFAGETPIQALPQFNVKELPAAARHLADQCRLLARLPAPAALTAAQAQHAALVAHHLFKGDSDHGIWLRLHAATDPANITAAAEALCARKAPKPMAEQSSDVTAATDPTAGEVPAAVTAPTEVDTHE